MAAAGAASSAASFEADFAAATVGSVGLLASERRRAAAVVAAGVAAASEARFAPARLLFVNLLRARGIRLVDYCDLAYATRLASQLS
jgi:hypothetical protein